MPPPPPPPPPPPGPPPPPSLGGMKKGGGTPASSKDRGALLSDIRSGAKLKPTQTNDRSGPQVGKVSNGPSRGGAVANGPLRPPPTGGRGAGTSGPPPPSVPMGSGNLFEELRNRNKQRFGGNTASGPANGAVNGETSENTRPEPPVIANKKPLPPTPAAPANQSRRAPPPGVNPNGQVANGQRQAAPPPPPPRNDECREPISSQRPVAEAVSKLQHTLNAHGGPAPPPSQAQKPSLPPAPHRPDVGAKPTRGPPRPAVGPSKKPETVNTNVRHQFRTLRPGQLPSSQSTNQPSFGNRQRSNSDENLAHPPPPPPREPSSGRPSVPGRPPQATTPSRPSGPPPPPPPQQLKPGVSAPSIPNVVTMRKHQEAPPPPPPPPPHSAQELPPPPPARNSSRVTLSGSNFDVRFGFLDTSKLPLPEKFLNTRKVYGGGGRRNFAPQVPS